ncbi:hypothetical protein KJ611_02150 [Patescibacteria group bacterium]|nr:hypothetical protein [Patescibacteria group bacterium]
MNRRISKNQIFRIVGILVFSIYISIYFPPVVFGDKATLTNPSIVMIVFVFLAGFLISQAIQRNRQLDYAISVEISRLRRIVHLTRNITAPAAWKNSIKKDTVDYLNKVAISGFRNYHEAHATFRRVTKMLYQYTPKTGRDQIIFKELLEVSRDAAYHSQRVGQLVQTYGSSYVWWVLGVVLVINIILLLGSREPGFTSQLFIAGAIAGLLLVLDMLYEQDMLTKGRSRWYQAMYAASAKDLRQMYR